MGNKPAFIFSKDSASRSVQLPTKILLIKTTEQADHHISKYQHYHDNPLLHCLECIRWKLNIALLFKPFSCLSQCKCYNECHQFMYRLTISELLFWSTILTLSIFPITWFIQTLFSHPILQWNTHNIIKKQNENVYINSPGNMYGKPTSICFVITWILSLRNTIWNFIFGFSFERAVTSHKYMGRLSLLLAFIHFWEYRDYTWFKGQCLTGVITFSSAILITFTSIGIFRRRIWTIFIKLHWILFLTFLVAGILHGAKYLWIAASVWTLDILYRIFLIYGKTVNVIDVKLLPCNVIRIEFDKLHFRFDAGQYIFICIPAIDCTQWHPFSISSPPHQNKSVMIHIRVLGDWTRKLYRFVSEKQKQQKNRSHNRTQRMKWNDLIIFVEGPYGQLQVPLHEYHSIIMISGGIGITPLQSIFNELVHNISVNSSPRYQDKQEAFHDFVQRIHFVWSVRDPSMVAEFGERHWAGIQYKNTSKFKKHLDEDMDDYKDLELFESRLPHFYSPDLLLVQQGMQMVQRTKVITQFHLTRVDKERQQRYAKQYKLLKFGRANIEKIIRRAKNEYQEMIQKLNISDYGTEGGCCVSDDRGKGICILCCGPVSMIRDVKKYASKYNMDCHIEIFEL